MDSLGFAAGEGHLLSYLASYGPCSVGELHRVLGHRKSTLTGILDRLEGAGFVTRTLDAGDRRSFRVDATATGRKRTVSLRRMLDAMEAAVTARITAGDLRGFERVMTAIGEATRVEVRRGESSGRGKAGTP
jgi:DNA-binding MarR family transcriptional regulator